MLFTMGVISRVLLFSIFFGTSFPNQVKLEIKPRDLSVVVGESAALYVVASQPLATNWSLTLKSSSAISVPGKVIITSAGTAPFSLTGNEVVSNSLLEIDTCSTENGSVCEVDLTDAYSRVSVMKSQVVDILVIVVGWIYFFAWSISFYPQIILNFQRKSVIGLNFDYLFLNIIGFAAYTGYNSLIYWNYAVQEEYIHQHPKSPLPVLLNDVIFAIHALSACIFIVFQAAAYERGNQRVHPTSLVVGCVLICASILGFILSICHAMTILNFVTLLSYIKMVVTMYKYFPQAIFNYRRKSTVGWSIGNVLLDFTGGSLDVLQMVLQAWNVDDWSAFVGNPVKFGLGMVSMIFDVVFMVQHYVLYRDAEDSINSYEGVENFGGPIPTVTHRESVTSDSQEPIIREEP